MRGLNIIFFADAGLLSFKKDIAKTGKRWYTVSGRSMLWKSAERMSFIETSVSKIFRNPPQIETERLLFRGMQVRDTADMYEYSSDPRTVEYLLWSVHDSISYTRSYLSYIEGQYKQGRFYDWAVILKDENKMIGTGGYTAVDEKNAVGQIGYVLNPSYWNRGYGTEIAKELLSFGFNVLKLNRIEALYMQKNERSRHVMEKCGMTFEGISREMLFVKGAFRDIGRCAILKSEYFSEHPRKEYKLHTTAHWYDLLH